MDNGKLRLSDNEFIERLSRLSRREEEKSGQLELFKDGNEKIEVTSSEPTIPVPDLGVVERQQEMLEQINNQRLKQRKILLWFIIVLTSLIAVVFIVMLGVNIMFNVFEKPPVFSDAVLSIVGVSFFIELIAVIKIVTEKLWDERQFLDSEAFRSIPKDKTEK